MNTELSQRIHRIYSSIKAVEETDPNKLKATVITTDKCVGVFQDFRGGRNDAELSNLAHMLIYNIAHLKGYLIQWAKDNGHNKTKVNQTVGNSLDLQIIIDLSNRDKHVGRPRRDGGESKKRPQLVNINSVMHLKPQAKKDSTNGMTLGANGVPKFFGDGTAKEIITGDIVDNKNNRIGDLHEIATKAVEAWEQLLTVFGCSN